MGYLDFAVPIWHKVSFLLLHPFIGSVACCYLYIRKTGLHWNINSLSVWSATVWIQGLPGGQRVTCHQVEFLTARLISVAPKQMRLQTIWGKLRSRGPDILTVFLVSLLANVITVWACPERNDLTSRAISLDSDQPSIPRSLTWVHNSLLHEVCTLNIPLAKSVEPNQTARTRRLIWINAGRICH